MRTVWAIARVAGFMVYSVVVYAFAGLRDGAHQRRVLNGLYVRWARTALSAFDAALAVEGDGLLPPPGDAPRVLLCNHQSQLDIPALVAALGEQVGFVAKKELGNIPLLSFWMRRVGCVFIDRADRSGARESLAAAARNLGAHPLVVFPEGTRSKTGALLPIKSGGLRMAIQAGAWIVPVHVRNTRAAFEAHAPGAPSPVPVRLRFFPPLDARRLPDEKASWLKVKAYLEECWADGEAGN